MVPEGLRDGTPNLTDPKVWRMEMPLSQYANLLRDDTQVEGHKQIGHRPDMC